MERTAGIKQDRRVRRTQAAIKKAFLSLLKEKAIDKITVTELCREVDINRSTFYQHYCDIYQLLEDIKSDFLARSGALAEKIVEEDISPNDVTVRILHYIYENKELLYLLLFQYRQPDLEKKIHEGILNLFCTKVLQSYTVPSSVTRAAFDDLLLFLTAGFYSVYERWILDECTEGISTVAERITALSQVCLESMLIPKPDNAGPS